MSDQLPRRVAPETFALHGAYRPALSEGALKPPVFQTSTFVARTAAELALWFDQAYGLDGQPPRAPDGLIYSRVVNPNLQIFEERWSRFERAAASALFGSGMAAISTTMLTFLRPTDQVIYTTPVYGGTAYLMEHVLPAFGIETIPVPVTWSGDRIVAHLIGECDPTRVKVIFMESPANPTLKIADIKGLVSAMPPSLQGPKVIVDSTVLGPLFMRPLDHGADIVLHSATKSIGGHSDLTAGIAAGSKQVIGQIKAMRTITGTMCGPQTAWLLTRSLETYKVRVEAAEHKAVKVARFLKDHPDVLEVLYPGNYTQGEPDPRFQMMCKGSGSLMSFRVKGGKEAAYRVLDALQVIKLAVSLGGTESLAEHPGTHTHSDIPPETRLEMGITEDMIRLSVGLEDADDIIADLRQALAQI